MLLLMLQNLNKANNSKSCFIKHDKTLKHGRMTRALPLSIYVRLHQLKVTCKSFHEIKVK